MRRLGIGLALGVFLAVVDVASAAPALTWIGTGFDHPVHVTAPRGDPHRIFVVERAGTVRIVRDGARLAQPFLDVSADADVERTGLASMAFAPDYDRTGHVYVLYAGAVEGDPDGHVVKLDELTRGEHPDRVDPGSRRNVLSLDFSHTGIHDAGHVEFGPDGLLYVSIGEGQQDALAQDTYAPRGKVLRIAPRPGPDGAPYEIPPSNPFVGGGGMPEVFAYGLRNPWRFSFDPAGRSIAIADVGNKSREELSLLSIDGGGGANLGWPCWEGTKPHNACEAPNHVPPVFEQQHDTDCRSIIGGYVGRDPRVPTLMGRYVYGEYCTGAIGSLVLGSPAASDARDTGVSLPPLGLNSFGEDGCGHLYVTHDEGAVWRIDEEPYVPCPEPPAPAKPPPPPETPAGKPRDLTPPRLRLARVRLQSLHGTHKLVIRARCDERCRLTATGRLMDEGLGRRARLVPRARTAAAGIQVTLKLGVRESALGAVRRLTRKHGRALARVVVTARDASGNRATGKRWIAVTR